MNIGIIGAGFTGLSAAYRLAGKNEVTVFENMNHPGGLAIGFVNKNWDWTLEEHYHHWFTNDGAILRLAEELGHKVIIERPKTSVIYKDKMYQLDSFYSLLKFSRLSFLDRLRVGATLGYFKATPWWKPLEGITAQKFLKNTMGKEAWEILWKQLFDGKFGEYRDKIPASWFWARVHKRTPSLAYPEGGFLKFSENLMNRIISKGGKVKLDTSVSSISKVGDGIRVIAGNKNYDFDGVISTLPTPLFSQLVDGLPQSYLSRLKPLKGTGAVTLVLSLKEQFLKDNTYWLNVNEKGYPFVAVVEHTNFIEKKHYNNEHILYVGNYKSRNHKYFDMSATQLLSEYALSLKKINSTFNKKIINGAWVFKAPFAQPIIPLNYSKQILPLTTPIKGLYMANMQQVYPWDRGTNYAVEIGERVAELVIC